MADAREKYLLAEIARSKDKKRKDSFQKKLDEYRASQGGQTSAPQPESTPTDKTIQQTTDILDAGKGWSQGLVDQTLPPGSFGKIDATTSPEMQQYLNELNAYAKSLQQLTPLEQEALELMRNSLQGYNAPEVQLMRDQARQAIAGETATGLRAAQGLAARAGLRGAAGAAQQMGLLRNEQATMGNLERDLMVENVRETQRRKEAFSNYIQGTEAAKAARGLEGQKLYGGALSAEEQAKTGKETFNAAQTTNEAMTKAGLMMGGMGTFTGTLSGQQGVDYNQQYLDYLNKLAEQSNKLSNEYLNKLTGGSTGGSAAV